LIDEEWGQALTAPAPFFIMRTFLSFTYPLYFAFLVAVGAQAHATAAPSARTRPSMPRLWQKPSLFRSIAVVSKKLQRI
jgi:hypothetical protein